MPLDEGKIAAHVVLNDDKKQLRLILRKLVCKYLIYKQDKIYGPEFISTIDTKNRHYKYLMEKLNLNSNNKLISKTYFTSKHTQETGGKKIVKERVNFKQRKSYKKQILLRKKSNKKQKQNKTKNNKK